MFGGYDHDKDVRADNIIITTTNGVILADCRKPRGHH